MAKIQIASEFVVESLFKGAARDVRIFGARFDRERNLLELDLEGFGVPDAERVNAIFSVERFAVRFEPA